MPSETIGNTSIMTYNELTHFFTQAAHYPAETGRRRNTLLNNIPMREAAVLLAVVFREQQWQVLLTKRSAALSNHAGQIALAGGSRDQEDNSITDTALRETWEETGIQTQYWETFAPFPAYYTPSGYAVSPIPALCTTSPQTTPNSDEVEEIFYLPLTLALDKSAYAKRKLQYSGTHINTPALPYLNYDIWGLTAMILYDLADRYSQYRQTA
ncbi:NUDIX hydrolase [Neisseria zalophi]|nr:CoA pyrophosphatase [Neisseria zalophi]